MEDLANSDRAISSTQATERHPGDCPPKNEDQESEDPEKGENHMKVLYVLGSASTPRRLSGSLAKEKLCPLELDFIKESPKSSPKISRRESSSPRSKSVNNLIYMTLIDNKLESFKKLISFVSLKIMAPLFAFTLICSLLVYAHIQIGDYCFYPLKCSCGSLLVYIYTIFKETLFVQSGILIVLYFGTSYVSNDFFKQKRLKVLYCCFMFLVLVANFFGLFQYQNQQFYGKLITICGYGLIGGNYVFLFAMSLFNRKLDQEFMKRTVMASILGLSLFFHRFYLKSYAMFAFLDSVISYFGAQLGLNVFKMALMGYYLIYESFTEKLLLVFFKKILKENDLSYNMAIFTLKFVSVDVLSINAFNILTIPLTEVYAWVSFAYYLYSIISCYTRTNLAVSLPLRIVQRIRGKKQEKETKQEERFFQELKSGCIFETNLIVFLRIISFKIFNFFVIFTPEPYLYSNCRLQENPSKFAIYDENVILLMTSHTFLLVLLGIVVYVCKKEKYLFDYHVEEMNVLGRFFFFMTCFATADSTLQIYKAFQNMQ